MKISTRGEYGIRAVLYVAMHGTTGPVTSHEIAENMGVPEAYLRQILAVLARDGLIASTRGPFGGHVLGRAAESVAVRDVLVALEGQTTSVDDILSRECRIGIGTDHCVIREVLLRVKASVDEILAAVSFAELASRQREILDRGICVPRDVDRETAARSLRVVGGDGE